MGAMPQQFWNVNVNYKSVLNINNAPVYSIMYIKARNHSDDEKRNTSFDTRKVAWRAYREISCKEMERGAAMCARQWGWGFPQAGDSMPLSKPDLLRWFYPDKILKKNFGILSLFLPKTKTKSNI